MLSHASMITKCITICVPSIPASKLYLNKCWQNHSNVSEDTKFMLTWLTMPARAQNDSKNVLIKPLPCQQGLKTHPMPVTNASQDLLTNLSHACKDKKSVSTCVNQYPLMFARKWYESQDVLTKQFPSEGVHKMYLNVSWTNPSHASEDTKSSSTFFE